MTSTTMPIIDTMTTNPLEVIPVWSGMMSGARSWAEENGFTAVHNMPHIAGASGSCEQFMNTFKLEGSEEFFGKRAFLVQSGQLYLEIMTPLFGKVYAEIQSFRKEPTVDDRHLAQFTLFEIEHLGDLNELMDNIEGVVKASIRSALPYLQDDARTNYLRDVLTKPFARITYSEAIEVLQEFYPDLSWGDDLVQVHEEKLTEIYSAVLVREYPEKIKFFSMVNNEKDPRVVDSCDLLLPMAGESAGAAQRVTDYNDLVRKLKSSDMYKMMLEQGVKEEEFDWYLNHHRDNTIDSHSGAGIGMARVAQYILGCDDIRDAAPFVINSENLL